MTRRRWLPRVAARFVGGIAVALVGGTVMFSTFATEAGAASPALTVYPASGLVPGAQVAFLATGLPAGVPVEVDECHVGGAALPTPSDCTPIAGSVLLTAADGSVQGAATVVSGAVGSMPGAGCPAAPPEQCVVAVVSVGTGGAEAEAPIAFAPGVAVASAPGIAPGVPVASAPAHLPSPPPTQAVAPPTTAAAAAQSAASRALAGPARAVAAPSHTVRVRGSRRWALGLSAMVLAAALAGAGRGWARLRRSRSA